MAVAPKYHTADQGVPTELCAGGGALLRLRRARLDRRHARSVDQREFVVYALATRGDRRLAHTALDREDGVRGTRRYRADVRLTAKTLHPHRCAADGHGLADPCRGCRPLAHLCSPRPIVCAWRNAAWRSAPSFRTWSRMRCPRRWSRAPIPRATSARTTLCAWSRHGAGTQSARGVGWRPRCRRPLRLARQFHAAPGRFPDRPDYPSDFGRRRVPARHRNYGTAARSTGGFSAAASYSALSW